MSFSLTELLIVGLVALFVIGPKDLPRVMRQLGHYAGRLKRHADEWMLDDEAPKTAAVKPSIVIGDDGKGYEAYPPEETVPPAKG